jgi:murein DD-endopeptidase MepM/ murein hydrolase activator NlpD
LQHVRASARLTACALALCGLAAAPPAAGQTSTSHARSGGASFVAAPKITKVSCLRRCASRKRIRGGSTLRVGGSALTGVTGVTFHGGLGSSDDLSVSTRPGTDTRVLVRVPTGALAGPVSLTTADGLRSAPSRTVPILPPPPPEPTAALSPVPSPAGAPAIETGTSRVKAYVGARRAVTFSFRLSGVAPAALSVELVRAADGAVVRTWVPDGVVPGQVQSVGWDGRLGTSAAPPGRYSFRLSAAAADGTRATSSQAGDLARDTFDLYDHIFPVRGRHDFGGGGSGFGAGRSGHSHQGHDVFARCGVPLVAARGGRIQYSGYHGAAGHYIVIDGAGTDVDYAYMHLAEASPFRAGDRVYTGQRVGAVGESGNARGCHLHFELWSGPGWYDGGDPFDPLPALAAWDSWS